MNSWWVMRPATAQVSVSTFTLRVELKARPNEFGSSQIRPRGDRDAPREGLAGHDVEGLGDASNAELRSTQSPRTDRFQRGQKSQQVESYRVLDHGPADAGRVALGPHIVQRGGERRAPALGQRGIDEDGELAVAVAARVDVRHRSGAAQHRADGRGVGGRVDDDVPVAGARH